MKSELWAPRIISSIVWVTFLPSSAILAQQTGTVHAVVTASTRFDTEGTLTIPRKSITVDLGRKPQEVLGWMPLRGTRAGLQLALLIDDSLNFSFPRLDDIENFIEALPPTTQIAVGYMQNGRANIAQSFSNNHGAAASTLWTAISTTGDSTGRYPCLSDLIKQWPGGKHGQRREVVIVTDGIDPHSGWASYCADDPDVQATISDAQKSNVIVYYVNSAGVGWRDVDNPVEKASENYLIQISNATGGKAYFGYPVTLAPFLFDILCNLDNQYELSFVTAAENALESLEVKTTAPNTRLRAPEHIWIKNRAK